MDTGGREGSQTSGKAGAFYDGLYEVGADASARPFPRRVLTFRTRYRVDGPAGRVVEYQFTTEGDDLRAHRRAFARFVTDVAPRKFPGGVVRALQELPVMVQGWDGKAVYVRTHLGLTELVESLPLTAGLLHVYRTPYRLQIGGRILAANFDGEAPDREAHRRSFQEAVANMVAGPRVIDVETPRLVGVSNERGQRLSLEQPELDAIKILRFFGFL